MTITDARFRQVGRELVLQKTLLARDRRRADVEDECDASAAQRPDEGVDRSAIVANGANRVRPHVEAPASPRWASASKPQSEVTAGGAPAVTNGESDVRKKRD